MDPYLQRHPYTNIGSGLPSSPYLPYDFFPTLYLHFNASRSGGALPPTSPLYQHRFRIPLLALPTLRFFPILYLHFNSSRSGGALSPTSPLQQHRIRIPLLALPTLRFFPDSASILTYSPSVGALPPTSPLHQHRIRIPLLALPTLRFFPTLYLHFNFSRNGGALPPSPLHHTYLHALHTLKRLTRAGHILPTYNITPTLTRPSRPRGVSRPVVDHTNHHGGTHVRIFSHTLFTKNNLFLNIFLVPFRGPAGLDAHIFESLSRRYAP